MQCKLAKDSSKQAGSSILSVTHWNFSVLDQDSWAFIPYLSVTHAGFSGQTLTLSQIAESDFEGKSSWAESPLKDSASPIDIIWCLSFLHLQNEDNNGKYL